MGSVSGTNVDLNVGILELVLLSQLAVGIGSARSLMIWINAICYSSDAQWLERTDI